jgi:hypothetical protein
MVIEDWSFEDGKNVMVLTTKKIMKENSSIVYVSHDEEDGMWQFHEGSDIGIDDAMVVSLEEVVSRDNTIKELYNLPLGWIAWRDAKNSEWKRIPNNCRYS